jgi:hypothetical protein
MYMYVHATLKMYPRTSHPQIKSRIESKSNVRNGSPAKVTVVETSEDEKHSRRLRDAARQKQGVDRHVGIVQYTEMLGRLLKVYHRNYAGRSHTIGFYYRYGSHYEYRFLQNGRFYLV